jgi:hypothetical protein
VPLNAVNVVFEVTLTSIKKPNQIQRAPVLVARRQVHIELKRVTRSVLLAPTRHDADYQFRFCL